jgi:hypothetical protein
MHTKLDTRNVCRNRPEWQTAGDARRRDQRTTALLWPCDAIARAQPLREAFVTQGLLNPPFLKRLEEVHPSARNRAEAYANSQRAPRCPP